MKLLKCYVSSFGKLKNFTYDFNSNLNMFKEDNGWGKTTLSTFIKTMFYGIDNGRKGIDDSDRKKYRPWNSTEKFGGYIDFIWGDNSYKIERYFGNKEAEDSVRLFDIKTGKEYSNTKDLGKRIFGIDEEGFLSTTYFLQKDFVVKSNNSITEKFNSIFEEGKSDSVDKIIEKLENKAKNYKLQRGEKGLLFDTQNAIFRLNEEIESSKTAEATLKVVKDEIEALSQKTQNFNKEISILSSDFRKAAESEAIKVKKDRFNSTKERLDILKSKILEVENVLNGYNPTNIELDSYSELYGKFIAINEKINALTLATEELKKAILQKPATDKKINPLSITIGIIFLIVLAVGIILFNKMNTTYKIFFFVFLIVLFVGEIFTLKKKKRKEDNAYNNLIDKNIIEINQLNNIKEDYAKSIANFISKFNLSDSLDIPTKINFVKNALSNKQNFISEAKEIERLIELYSQDKDVFVENLPILNVSKIEIELNEKRRAFQNLSDELARKKASVIALEEKSVAYIDAENKKEALKEKLKEYSDDYNIIVKTIEYLKKADEELKSKYKEPLENSFRKYISLIAGTSYSDAKIDIDLNVLIPESGGAREPEYYSKGYRNLFDICKRFALIDVLFNKEKPFIILDDPFYNLDEDKISHALKLIEKLSEEYQIIYMVCHQSRAI